MKSHPSKEPLPRRQLKIVQERVAEDSHCVYKDFAGFQIALQRTKLEGWAVSQSKKLTYFNSHERINALPKYSLVIENSLRFTIAVFNWKLPNNNHIYTGVKRSLKFIKLSKLLSMIKDSKICTGLVNEVGKASACLHIVPSTLDITNDTPFQYTQYHRPPTCHVILQGETNGICDECKKFEVATLKTNKAKTVLQKTAVKSRAPLSATSHSRLKATVFSERMKE